MEMQVLYKGEPININREVMEALCWNAEKTHLEFMLYVYVLANGSEQVVLGETFTAYDFTIDDLVEYFGYSKSRVYRAIQRLVDFGIATKLAMNSRTESRTILLITDTVNFEKIKNTLPRRRTIPADENDSTTVERFHAGRMILPGENDSTDSEETRQDITNKELTSDVAAEDSIEGGCTIGSTSTRFNTYSTNTVSRINTESRSDTVSRNKTVSRNNTVSRNMTGTRNNTVSRSNTVSRNKKQESCQKVEDGHYASDYAPGGARNNQIPRSDTTAAFRYFMHSVYAIHRIDYFIPKSKIPHILNRSSALLKQLGGLDKFKLYVEWYLNASRFKAKGYPIYLLLSSAVMNEFLSADSSVSKIGIGMRMIEEDEREEYVRTHGIII